MLTVFRKKFQSLFEDELSTLLPLIFYRSQRCRQCEHNLSKPEYNPTSIKFKIQLAAFYHVPEVIIFQLAREPLKPGADTTFVLKVTNPTQHPTSFQLMDLDQGKVLYKLVSSETLNLQKKIPQFRTKTFSLSKNSRLQNTFRIERFYIFV